MHFLGIMSDIKPIGKDEWEEVVRQHNQVYPERNLDSIRRKYQTLHRMKKPTGDPDCPEHVRLAKRVKYSIAHKADLGLGDEELEMPDGADEDGVADGGINNEDEEAEQPDSSSIGTGNVSNNNNGNATAASTNEVAASVAASVARPSNRPCNIIVPAAPVSRASCGRFGATA